MKKGPLTILKNTSWSQCLSVVLLLLWHGDILAQAEEPALDLSGETVVVYNQDFARSLELAEYYAEQRGIAKDHLIGLDCTITDSLSRQDYEQLIRKPLFETFVRRGWWKLAQSDVKDPITGKDASAMIVQEASVRIVTLMRGVPFQIRRDQQNPQNAKEDEASVDSEICHLGMARQNLAGALRNPYFDQKMRFQMFRSVPGLLLVGRLDAPDADTVKRMIDDAISTEKTGLRGRAVVDLAQKSGAYQEGEDWLARTAILFREHGIPVHIDKDEALFPDHWPLPDTALYFGWYSSIASGAVSSPSFRFMPGAIACHLHSYSAAAIRSTDRHWVGPLLNQGAAATLGNVFEPYLSLTVHFDIFNQRLLEGYTLVEAAWNATPVISWMNVVCGDPLYRPYAKGPGSSMGEGRARDYALYQGAALKLQGNGSKDLKRVLTEMAETRSKPHLLELTALLSASEGRVAEAIELLEHAESLYVIVADKARALLYLADLQRRDGKVDKAKTLLLKITQDPAYRSVPALLAAQTLLGQL